MGRWWKRRNSLRYSEHFLVLLCVALNTGALFGFVTYLLFALAPRSLAATPLLLAELATTDSVAAALDIENSYRIIRSATALRRSVARLPDSLLPLQATSWSDFLRHSPGTTAYRLDLPFASPRIAVLKYTGRRRQVGPPQMIVPRWSVEFTDTNVTYLASPTTQPIAGYPDGPYVTERSVSRALLDSLIALRTLYEVKYWLPRHLLRMRDRPSAHLPPPYLFIYQEAMALLGANPNYFTPTSAGSRAAFFIYTLARYLFTALFISTIVREWWSNKGRRNAP